MRKIDVETKLLYTHNVQEKFNTNTIRIQEKHKKNTRKTQEKHKKNEKTRSLFRNQRRNIFCAAQYIYMYM